MPLVTEARWWAAHAAAQRAFARIPGVVGVGLGVKEKAGQLTGEVAVIVYVDEKRARTSLGRTELIPAEIEGVKTDVQRLPHIAPFGGTTLKGGVQIRRTPDAQDHPAPGTLGYVATRTADNLNVMLSCDHVMLSGRRDDMRIFHPDVSRCCGSLKNAVGGVIDGYAGPAPYTNSQGPADYHIDAAIATIAVSARKVIPDVGQITGSGDLTATPVGGANAVITVRKRGAATGVTEGTVDDVAFGGARRVMKIRPKPGHTFPFSKTWKVPPADIAAHLVDYPAQSLGGTATQVSADEVRFDVPVFAVPADSGAAVVNTADGKIVGLVIAGSMYELPAYDHGRLRLGGMPSGFTIACHIPPVLPKLGIRIDPSTESSAGRGVLVPGDEITADAPDALAVINARLAELEHCLDATPTGRRINVLVRTHGDELIDLVHRRRPVLVEWHRCKGPAFAALLIEALLDGDRALPAAVEDVSRDAMLTRMKRALDAAGSPRLRAAMAENEPFLIDLLERSHTVDELVANLT